METLTKETSYMSENFSTFEATGLERFVLNVRNAASMQNNDT
jgi:hypothetical protein